MAAAPDGYRRRPVPVEDVLVCEECGALVANHSDSRQRHTAYHAIEIIRTVDYDNLREFMKQVASFAQTSTALMKLRDVR